MHVEGATPSVKPDGEATSVPELQVNEDTPLVTPPHGDPLPRLEVDSVEQAASKTQMVKVQMAPPRLPQPLYERPPYSERGDSSKFQDGGASPSQPESRKDIPTTESSEISSEMLELKRVSSLELQLKELLDSTKSLTAKENLLLSLRY